MILINVLIFIVYFNSVYHHISSNGNQNIELWNFWKHKYEQIYGNLINQKQQDKFEKNLAIISQHNLKYDLGLETYEMGLNLFTATNLEELYPASNSKASKLPTYQEMYSDLSANIDEPDTWNWVEQGYVTPVKYQGDCNSDWAFSAVGALEGLLKLTGDKLISLSAQQLVDCSWEFGNQGCNHGEVDLSLAYTIQNGIESNSTYSYFGKVNNCTHLATKSIFKPQYYGYVKSGNETILKKCLYKYGPIAVKVDGKDYLRYYKSGIYQSFLCSSIMVNQPLLLVGYGQENGIDYWLLKSSWGVDWGENGYIRLRRNKGNMCGIATFAVLPLLS